MGAAARAGLYSVGLLGVLAVTVVGSAAVGMTALNEPVTARKLAGLAFAVVAVYLTSTS